MDGGRSFAVTFCPRRFRRAGGRAQCARLPNQRASGTTVTFSDQFVDIESSDNLTDTRIYVLEPSFLVSNGTGTNGTSSGTRDGADCTRRPVEKELVSNGNGTKNIGVSLSSIKTLIYIV